ncbi:hypothetical protein E2F46_14800 [Luteimonas aestuarii]|uniref:Uncharacterized protein n=1 Tax=Luteimonas aestuarii TaxID=453837 RepID=A0A4V3ALC6_9GAMM|nr:hypothetical protein [Luteimonas aestuarii]TDK21501.1 hypothetical protein E2F46_14800 [Luteimonas aestuarii]
MALLFLFVLLALAWSLGAVQLWPRMRRVGDALPWLGGALGVAVAACVVLGLAGLMQHGGWGSPSIDRVVHHALGEGNLVMRRTDWAWLNRVSNIYLQLDVAWTLVALCVAVLHGWGFWAGLAMRGRARTSPR